ncbi:MAG TPA: lytic transglycosylase domain-containing protein [Pyrinomonadaceae bacterium]|nr:lytic transglycosylase domain-containing protein [Pyrinomonadaceae bacterium]
MGKVCLFFVLFIFLVFSISAQTNQNQVYKSNLLTETGKSSGDTTDKESELTNSSPLSFLQLLENKSLGDFSTGDAEIDRFIEDSSARYDIDPLLIFAQMNQESRFKQKAVSHKGASGLMQLMPATAIRFGVKNIYDPKQNIEAGVKYMRWLLNRFDGDLRLALAGYNAGEGAVKKYDNQIPPYRETQTYVAKITTHYMEITNEHLNSNILNNAIEHQVARAFEAVS